MIKTDGGRNAEKTRGKAINGTAAEIKGIISKYFLTPDGMPVFTPKEGTLLAAYSSARKEMEEKEPQVEEELKKLGRKERILNAVGLAAYAIGLGAIASAIIPALSEGSALLKHAADHPAIAEIGGLAAIVGGVISCRESMAAAYVGFRLTLELDNARSFLERARIIVMGRING
ncbi:Uncharacterised protein [uncultured archaeon]|nr:Uncharacterised protein [uncultured archaeon]